MITILLSVIPTKRLLGLVQMSPFLQDEGHSHISHIFDFHQLLKWEISAKFPLPVCEPGAPSQKPGERLCIQKGNIKQK